MSGPWCCAPGLYPSYRALCVGVTNLRDSKINYLLQTISISRPYIYNLEARQCFVVLKCYQYSNLITNFKFKTSSIGFCFDSALLLFVWIPIIYCSSIFVDFLALQLLFYITKSFPINIKTSKQNKHQNTKSKIQSSALIQSMLLISQSYYKIEMFIA